MVTKSRRVLFCSSGNCWTVKNPNFFDKSLESLKEELEGRLPPSPLVLLDNDDRTYGVRYIESIRSTTTSRRFFFDFPPTVSLHSHSDLHRCLPPTIDFDRDDQHKQTHSLASRNQIDLQHSSTKLSLSLPLALSFIFSI